MDDIEQLLGIKQDAQEALAMRELARRANDSLRVFNPLQDDYRVAVGLYDEVTPGGYFLVPGCNTDIGFGKGQNVHPRFVAFKFFKEISHIILDAEMRLRIQQENERRSSTGMKPLDKTFSTSEELGFVYENKLQPTQQDKLMNLLPKIILGVEREWGMDTIAYKPREDVVKWADVMAIIDRKVGSDVVANDVHPVENKAPDLEQQADPLKEVAA